MKNFVDLHMQPSIMDLNQVEIMVEKAVNLGYHFVGIPFPPNASHSKIRRIQKICSERGIDLVTRVNFAPKTPRELLNKLRHSRRRFEVVSIKCFSKQVARQAAKDRRVDLLLFPVDSRKRFFDKAEAELASGASASFEIDMAPLLLLNGILRVRLLSCLRREVDIARKFNIPIVISSGATSQHLLRTPSDYAALTMLFDLSPSHKMHCFSENPLAIIIRNREKLNSNFVAPGIRIIKRGRDCLDT